MDDSTIFFVGLGVVITVMLGIVSTLRAAYVTVRAETRRNNQSELNG